MPLPPRSMPPVPAERASASAPTTTAPATTPSAAGGHVAGRVAGVGVDVDEFVGAAGVGDEGRVDVEGLLDGLGGKGHRGEGAEDDEVNDERDAPRRNGEIGP